MGNKRKVGDSVCINWRIEHRNGQIGKITKIMPQDPYDYYYIEIIDTKETIGVFENELR